MTAISSTSPSISNKLTASVLWYGREVSKLGDPLDQEHPYFDFCARVITGIALLIIGTIAILPLVAAGWMLSHFITHQNAKAPQIDPPAPQASPAAIPENARQENQHAQAPQIDPPAPQASSVDILRNAREEIDRIRVLYNTLCDLKSPQLDTLLDTLFSQLSEFEAEFNAYRNLEGNETTFELLDQLKTNAKGMKAVLHYLKIRRPTLSEDIQRVPGDGNCWLHAVIRGLTYLNIDPPSHQTLRLAVVDWMRNHYLQNPILKALADQTIIEESLVAKKQREESFASLIEVQVSEAELEQWEAHHPIPTAWTLEDYFAHMQKEGSHGSATELYALSQMYNVNIELWNHSESELARLLDSPLKTPHPIGTINLVMVGGNHYDYLLPN